MPETTLTAAIMRYARSQGCRIVWKLHGSVYGETGKPDLFLIVPVNFQTFGVPVFIEVKQPGEKPRPLQEKSIRDLKRGGAVAIWADNLETVKEVLRQVKEQQYVP